jgi:hypothetical protein
VSGPALLHNMSVPPISTIQVRNPGLPGRTFCTTVPCLWKGYDPDRLPPPETLEAAFAQLGIPDCVGIFTAASPEVEPEARFGYPLALALLARRSGHLYLPWRAVYPALVPKESLFLVFPEEGGPS